MSTIKVLIDYSDGVYYPVRAEQDSPTVVEIPEEKMAEWEKFCDISREWNSYWRKLDNKVFAKNYPDDDSKGGT